MTGRPVSHAVLMTAVFFPPALCWFTGIDPRLPDRSPIRPVAVHADGLHNLFRVTPRIYSGSSPDDAHGFASLRALGVRTVLSVDGTAPDVRLARAYGLRYVHIPIGYDGIAHDKAWAIAKVARELPGPVYVHCHHGQHRGPAAAVCAMLALDPRLTPSVAVDWLKAAGTDPKYTGLTAVPHTFVRPTYRDLAALPATFPSVARVPDLVKLMVAVDGRFDHLKAAKVAGWATPPGDPDVTPRHEAVLLTELFREAGRLPASTHHGTPFLEMLREAEAHAHELERALAQSPVDGPAATRAFTRSQAMCSRCHVRFRN